MQNLDYLVFLASVQKHGTLWHYHSIDLAETFVPLILDFLRRKKMTRFMFSLLCHFDTPTGATHEGEIKILSADCLDF